MSYIRKGSPSLPYVLFLQFVYGPGSWFVKHVLSIGKVFLLLSFFCLHFFPLWLLRKSWNMKVKGKENDLVYLLVFLFESVVFLIVMFG